MANDAPTGNVIDIPAEPTLFRTANLGPVQVTLPIAAGPARLRSLAFIALAGVPAALLALVFCVSVNFSINPPTPGDSIGGVILLIVTVGPGLWTGGIALMAAVDLIRGKPLLVLDATGFWDMRMRHAIRWTEVERAGMTAHPRLGVRGVQLTLHKPIGARHNGFRWGASSDFFRRGPDEVFVPLRLLDVHAFVLARVITSMVERSGGRLVET